MVMHMYDVISIQNSYFVIWLANVLWQTFCLCFGAKRQDKYNMFIVSLLHCLACLSMLLVASSDYLSRSCNSSGHVITVRDRSLRRRSASRLYCVWGVDELFLVHVGELTFGCLGPDPDQPLTIRRRHHLPRSAWSRQKSVWLVLDLWYAGFADLSFVAETVDCWLSCEHCVRSFPDTLCRLSCAVCASDAVLLSRTIDWTVEHGRIFVILCIFVYIFVWANCCVPVSLYSRCYAECLCLYSRLTYYRSLFLDLFNELLFDRID